MTDKQIEQRCAWKSFEGTFCPEAQQQLDQLKAENERLKQAFAESDNDCFRLEKENNLLKVYRSIAPFKVKMLVQTLDEIKEIAITGLEGFCPKCSRKECEDNNCIETAIRDILQKISEVEDE